jgi:hypothetical protein
MKLMSNICWFVPREAFQIDHHIYLLPSGLAVLIVDKARLKDDMNK